MKQESTGRRLISHHPGRAGLGNPDRAGFVRGLNRDGFHRIAFTEWGTTAGSRPVLCLHGLSRNGRDFDFLAAALAEEGRRVLCPDLPGRGKSDRLPNGDDYVLPQYCRDMTVMMAALGSSEVDWVGTSLGGLVGIVLAALPGSPIRRIVVNDIGPYLPWSGLARLGASLNSAPNSFETMQQAETYFRKVLAPFGQLEDEHWKQLTHHSVAWDSERRQFSMLSDPKIARAFHNPWHYNVDLWKSWDRIKIPILVIRGEDSDLLSERVLGEMMKRNANVSAYTVQNCGHAPALMTGDQIDVVLKFLNQPRHNRNDARSEEN